MRDKKHIALAAAALALLLGAWLLLNQAEPGVAGFFKGGFSSNVTLPIALMR